MGWSIIWIFMFHSKSVGVPIYDDIQKFGWAGVDIFFFLSALGLSFSLEKNSDTLSFYKKRANRILPTWLIVLLCVHIFGLLCKKYLPSLPFDFPHTLMQCICWYTGIGFLISDFVSEPLCYHYEWYIPSLLFFYAITPILYKQRTKRLVIFFIAAIVISYILYYFGLLPGLRKFYLRFPAFFMGIFVYRIIKAGGGIYPHALCYSFILGLTSCVLLYGFDFKLPKYFAFQMLMPTVCLLFIFLTKQLRLVQFFSFFGGISLELYLIHIYKRPQYLMSFVFENKFLILISTLVICTIAAACLREVVSKVLSNKGILKRFNKISPKRID